MTLLINLRLFRVLPHSTKCARRSSSSAVHTQHREQGDKASDADALRRMTRNHQLIFDRRRTSELIRLYFVLGVSGIGVISRNAYWMFKFGHSVLGDRLFGTIFRPLIYDLFVAGETEEEWKGTMGDLTQSGLIPLLSPMLEDDLSDDGGSKLSVHAHNLEIICKCLRTCSSEEMTPKTLAFKLTAFVNPTHLELISNWVRANDSIKIPSPDGGEPFLEVERVISEKASEEGDDGKNAATHFREGMQQLINIVDEARRQKVMLLLDAEHSHLQPAVRYLAISLMRRANCAQTATVINTYQCYLKDSYSHLTEDLCLAEKYGFTLGAKLVRGAYLECETERSNRLNIENPVYPTYEETNTNYDSAVKCLLERVCGKDLAPTVILATHNESSVLTTVNMMKTMSINKKDKVHFAQIRGMGDQLSVPLSRLGYCCLKLVPCGSVSEVLPWLARRVQENAAARERAKKEKALAGKEIWRRIRAKVA